MKAQSIAKIISGVIKIAPMVKQWIFSDGKFNINRALILLAFFIALLAGCYFLGVDTVSQTIDMLDDVSDQIGYSQ